VGNGWNEFGQYTAHKGAGAARRSGDPNAKQIFSGVDELEQEGLQSTQQKILKLILSSPWRAPMWACAPWSSCQITWCDACGFKISQVCGKLVYAGQDPQNLFILSQNNPNIAQMLPLASAFLLAFSSTNHSSAATEIAEDRPRRNGTVTPRRRLNTL
jgi:hypothetical protein